MNLLAGLKRLFANLFKWRHDYRPNTERFQQLDLDKVAADLKLAASGRDRGSRNQPAAEVESYDDTEQRVVAYIEAERNHIHDRVSRELGIYDERLASFAFLSKLDEVKKSAHTAAAQLLTLRLQGQGEIQAAEQQVVQARRELSEFRAFHRLRRLPVYPDSLTLRWGLLGVIVVVESAVNGVIFAASNSFGLIGGIVYAFVLSALNVSLGLVVGRLGFPNLFHRNWLRKIYAIALSGLYIASILALNLLAAHLRDISRGTEALKLDLVLIPRVIEAPLALAEFSSWLLFVLGIVFSFVAAADGYSMDDRYPGYGPVWRRAKAAADDFNEGYAILLEHAETIRSATADALTSVIDSAEIELANYRTMVDGRQRLITSYKDYCSYLEQCANSLLEIYRHANRQARSESAPSTFNRSWRIAVDELWTRTLPGSLQVHAIDNHIKLAVAEIQQLRNDLLADHKATIEVFAPIRTLIDQAAPDGQTYRL